MHLTSASYSSLRSWDAYGAPYAGVEPVEKLLEALSDQTLTGKLVASAPEQS